MQCTVFTIHWDDLCALGGTQWLHDGAGRNETFFVRQREALTTTKRFQRDWQTGKTDHCVHHDVRVSYYIGNIAAELHLGKFTSERAAHTIVDHRNELRVVRGNLITQS